jgi:hypothetical protein
VAGAHAKRSPSGSPAWTLCLAKLNREAGIPDLRDKSEAEKGTICHDISARVLQGESWAIEATLGKNALVNDATGDVLYRMPSAGTVDGHTVDQNIVNSARAYTGFVQQLAIGGELAIEQPVPIDHITGEKGAKGTSDAIILFPERAPGTGAEVCVVDLKSGREPVFAKTAIDEALAAVTGQVVGSWMPNTQLVMYASGSVIKHMLWHNIKRVRLIIVQPPLDHVDEVVLTIDEFVWWVDWIRQRAELSKDPKAPATPGEKQCKYCRFAVNCPELKEFSIATALANFDSPGQTPVVRAVSSAEMPKIYGVLDLIEGWCQSMRHRMFMELNSGTLDERSGWKLVRGRLGNRYWTDEERAKALMEQAGTAHALMYGPPQLISPTTADGNFAKTNPKLWENLKAIVDRADGKLTVAPVSDERPAVRPAHDAISAFDLPANPPAGAAIDITGFF